MMSLPESGLFRSKSSKIIYELRKSRSLNNIRVQLNDQLKCLDGRLESQTSMVSEFQDFFRRKSEIESNYSRELDKLYKFVHARHKEQKQRRESWSLSSSLQLWETLLQQTRKTSRQHAALAEISANHIVPRCSQINEDLQRMFRKCREICYEIHEEVLKVLHELHMAMKTHHSYQSEFRQSEHKLQLVEKQRSKLYGSVPLEKRDKHKRLRIIEKEFQKRGKKFEEAKLKATKARNEYILCMESANSAIQKYFVDDLSDLIDCMDLGFHQSLHRTIMLQSSAWEHIGSSLQVDVDLLSKSLKELDSRLDKQRFFEAHNSTFMLPKKFTYTPVRRDESEVMHQASILEELRTRKILLYDRLSVLKTESEEIWKSIETAEKTLQDMVGCFDYDASRFFTDSVTISNKTPKEIESFTTAPEISSIVGINNSPSNTVSKQKYDRLQTEAFYMTKFREYVLNSNRVARLQAKYDNICLTLGDQASNQASEGVLTMTRRPNAARRRRIGKPLSDGHSKLFGGSLEEYMDETNQSIPIVFRSCIRAINLFALHHQGIFRVSGSQVEINSFKDAFERGEDPLADMTDASDINSVAGVLKLYLRELREPIFPIQYFDHFMELAELESKHEFVIEVRNLVKSWPRSILVVMRYLFAFLNHISEFSDENMMDPFNLAICFGPTLLPIPEDRDQVYFQNIVNELIKNIIIFHEDIFPADVPGLTYEKYMTKVLTPADCEMGDSPSICDVLQDSIDLDSELTEDDSVFKDDLDRDEALDLFSKSNEVLEANALYDFKARSSREINFNKGDTIILYKQVSNDWWRGSVGGQEGLVPDKYIMLKIGVDEDKRDLDSSLIGREPSLTSLLMMNGVQTTNKPLSDVDEDSPGDETRHQPSVQSLSTAVASAPVDSEELFEASIASGSEEETSSSGSISELKQSLDKTLAAVEAIVSSKLASTKSLPTRPPMATPRSLPLEKERQPKEHISSGFEGSRNFWIRRSERGKGMGVVDSSAAKQQTSTPDLVRDLPENDGPDTQPVAKPRRRCSETNCDESFPLPCGSGGGLSRRPPVSVKPVFHQKRFLKTCNDKDEAHEG